MDRKSERLLFSEKIENYVGFLCPHLLIYTVTIKED